ATYGFPSGLWRCRREPGPGVGVAEPRAARGARNHNPGYPDAQGARVVGAGQARVSASSSFRSRRVPTWRLRQYPPSVQECADAIFVAERRGGIEAADVHPFGGVDEELVAQVDAGVHYAFRPAAARAGAEEQQVALLELAQVPVQRHL